MAALLSPGRLRPNRTALVVYGSETGNAQDVAGDVGRLLERHRFSTRVDELDSIGLNELTQFNLVVFAVSTTGQGQFPINARSLWKKMRSARLPSGCLSLLQFASFGLGDSSYPQFNWAHRKLFNRLKQLGAVPVCEKGEADAQHPEGIDGTLLPWLEKLRQVVVDLFPLPEDLPPIPDDQFLTPKWALEALSRRGSLSSTQSNLTTASGESLATNRQRLNATFVKNERLTPDDHWQDVRLLEFSTPAAFYEPGDVVTIFPRNTEGDAQQFLELMDWTSIADQSLAFVTTTKEGSVQEEGLPPLTLTDGATLRQLLIECFDINAIPRRSFFSQIAHFTTDETQRERLLEFTKPEYVDELYDYTTRPRRSILEVLQEFYTVKVPFKWAAAVLPVIKGRQFSIASGGRLNYDEHGHGRIQLLVAIVKYRTVIKKIRQGLCTRYLTTLKLGDRLDVLICRGAMNHSANRPAIMIGPGTGVAPLRAMLYERAASVDRGATEMHDTMLFFGGRNRSADYFFEHEWPDLSDKTGLEVVTAFSRDQKAKYYVQDALRKHAPSVYKILQAGDVYICGSSGKMPQAVRATLLEIIQQEGPWSEAEAESALEAMEKSGRYQQETW